MLKNITLGFAGFMVFGLLVLSGYIAYVLPDVSAAPDIKSKQP